jgi:PqqD family protein of HPr-rel-A system
VVAPDALLWEHFEEESLLFDRRSGQTHLMPLITVECLTLLQERAMDLGQLCEGLEIGLHPDSANEVRSQIAQLLHTLNELGLIMSVSQ